MPGVDRIDHSGRTVPQEHILEGERPIVSPSLIAYLEAEFTAPPPRIATGMDDILNDACRSAAAAGAHAVIEHLRTLTRSA